MNNKALQGPLEGQGIKVEKGSSGIVFYFLARRNNTGQFSCEGLFYFCICRNGAGNKDIFFKIYFQSDFRAVAVSLGPITC